MFSIKFWGVRGSIPTPGKDTTKYGGNTASIQLKTDLDYEIIIDLGTGVKALGRDLFSDPNVKKPLDIKIFMSHTHWDHIMGFPFFAPIYPPDSKVNIYGPAPLNGTLEEAIGGQLRYQYFPVRLDELRSDINYHPLQEGNMEFDGGMKISYVYLNHPLLCLGYKFEYKDKIIATCYDHEPFSNLFANDPENTEEGEQAAKESNEKISKFFKDADILVHDAQYTTKDYEKYVGWGHSTYRYAIDQAIKANVKKLVIFHHDPERKDKHLDIIQQKIDKNFSDYPIEIMLAKEGMELSALETP